MLSAILTVMAVTMFVKDDDIAVRGGQTATIISVVVIIVVLC